MRKSTDAFSIVLALGMVVFMTFMGLYVIEYMIPFSRNTKGVENASKAFYQAYSGLEHALYELDEEDPSLEANKVLSSNPKDFQYTINAVGNTIPLVGEGNSEYDNDWNILSTSSGIGFQIPSGISSLQLDLRVPDYDGNTTSDTLIDSTDVLIWQLSNGSDSLSSRNLVDVPFSANIFAEIGLRQGDATTAGGETFGSFYSSECGANQCILKFVITRELVSSNNISLPYLEYQIGTTGVSQIPLSHAYIDAQGLSYGFGKTLLLKQPQRSTNSAFDFAVFQ